MHAFLACSDQSLFSTALSPIPSPIAHLQDAAQMLHLEYGASLDEMNKEGETALLCAANEVRFETH